MFITAIERDGKRKYRFYIDGEYRFFLTDSELREYDLFVLIREIVGDYEKIDNLEVNLKEEVFESIHDNAVINRGRRYALGLLSDRDYTVKGLADKLKSVGYTVEDSESIIDYVSGFNYLNDVRYAVNYIRSRESQKSRKYIQNQLMLKGVSSKDIQQAFEMISEEHEKDGVSNQELIYKAINAAIRRKLKPADLDNSDKVTKVIASLLRSGYNYSDIKQCLNEYIKNDL